MSAAIFHWGLHAWAIYGIVGLATADSIPGGPRVCLLCLVGGLGLLLALTIRARVRLLPFDPYRKVQR